MSNHTGPASACQYPPGPDARETTPPLPPLDGIDRRLVARYGACLLVGGYTALPTYAWVYYARLGVTEAEMVLIAQLCTYWWSERDPYPGEAALAARMGKTVRTIQGYLRSLEAKGLLHIETRFSKNGQHQTNSYDVRPFFRAVEGLARLDGSLDAAPDGTTPATADASPRDGHTDDAGRGCHARPTKPDTEACKTVPGDQNNNAHSDAERGPLCAGARGCKTDTRPTPEHTPPGGEGEGSRAGRVKDSSPQVNPVEVKSFDSDSIPPTPAHATNARFRMTGGDEGDEGDEGPQLPDVARPEDHDGQALAAEIAALSAALGDDAPRSSLGRARNLHRDANMSLARFLCTLDEASARTRDRQASIVKRRRDGEAPNGMPYLFAVLQDLLHPAPARARRADVGPDRRRDERPDRRRRRRDDGHGEPAGSYAAWSDSPEHLPIVEAHPVWRAALDALAQVMTVENFNAWLASTRALDQDGDVLRVAVPAPFTKTWLEQKLAGKVMGALQKIDYATLGAGRVERVEYVVEAA